MDEFIKGVIVIVTTIVIAYITTRLTTIEHCTQKWWERKAEAYSDLIEQLFSLQDYYRKLYNEWAFYANTNENDEKKREEQANNAIYKLRKAATTGAFIISEDAANLIKELQNKLSSIDNKPLHEQYEESSGMIGKYIERIKASARIHLGINPPWWRRFGRKNQHRSL